MPSPVPSSQSGPPVTLPRIDLIVLRAADLQGTADFYALFGVAFERHQHASGPEHLAAALNGLTFEIYPSAPHEETAGVRLGFKVNDLDATHARLVERGAEIIKPPTDSQWGRRMVVNDPNGNRVEITEG